MRAIWEERRTHGWESTPDRLLERLILRLCREVIRGPVAAVAFVVVSIMKTLVRRKRQRRNIRGRAGHYVLQRRRCKFKKRTTTKTKLFVFDCYSILGYTKGR